MGEWGERDLDPVLRAGSVILVSREMNPYIAQITMTFIQILTWAIIARSLMSWLPIGQDSPLVQMLNRVTEPLIEPIRRLMPQNGGFDLSPMFAIIVLIVLSQLVASVAKPL
jgi:YggT family protein